jgi:hypothetical protein
MAAARGGVDGRGRTRGRRWRGQGGESMDKAGRGGGEEEKTVALCVGPEISLPLGVRGEEGSGLISSGLVYVLYHTGRVCA